MRSRLSACTWILAATLCTSAAPAADTHIDLGTFAKTYCADCHSGDAPEGDVRLEASPGADSKDHSAWERALRMLREELMPPEDAEQPAEAERRRAVAAIEAMLEAADLDATVDPGHVTLRRLNRAEYANTIRDLLAVEFQAADDFPADDVGYGFDNIGDVLSLPPLLMEKYLDAAAEIADRALVSDPAEAAPKLHRSADQLRSTAGGSGDTGARVLSSSGEIYVDERFARGGEYIVRVRAYGDQAGDEPARMELRLDRKTLAAIDVPAESADPSLYELKATIAAGKHRLAVAFVNDYYRPDDPDPERRDRNLGVLSIEIVGPLDLRAEDFPASHRRIMAAAAGAPAGSAAAARNILRHIAARAYRRPVTDAELARLVQLWQRARDEKEAFEGALELVLQAILVSPHFLFRVELDPPPGEVRALDDYELATRLSYFLWSSMPDEALFDEARQGTLRKNLEPQVRRMLADEKSAALVENFALQWLQLRNLANVEPDRRQFAFDDELRAAMLAEARLFFAHIVGEDRPVTELLNADYTFANERLARHYGIEGVKGDKFRRVALAGSPRGGVATMAAVLTVTSNPTRTSPVKRGKWILDNLLGEPPPDPPPGVPMLAEDRKAQLSGSLRQRMEQHRADPNCAICHRKMDALGFALENFDAVGAWRTKDGKFAIDPSGTLPDGRSLRGPAELKEVLATSGRDQFVRCLTERLLTYALGRGVERSDRAAVNQITAALAADDYRFSRLVLEIARSDPFQKRRAAEPEKTKQESP